MSKPRRRRRATLAEILEQVSQLQRQPFQEAEAELLAARPRDAKSLRAVWSKSYDRAAQAAAIWARLGGYTEKTEVHVTGLVGFAVKLAAVSDSEFEQAKLEYDRKRSLPALPATPEPAQPTTRTRSFEDEQRDVHLRRSQQGLGVQRPADLIRPAPPPPIQTGPRFVGNDGDAPPPGA